MKQTKQDTAFCICFVGCRLICLLFFASSLRVGKYYEMLTSPKWVNWQAQRKKKLASLVPSQILLFQATCAQKVHQLGKVNDFKMFFMFLFSMSIISGEHVIVVFRKMKIKWLWVKSGYSTYKNLLRKQMKTQRLWSPQRVFFLTHQMKTSFG